MRNFILYIKTIYLNRKFLFELLDKEIKRCIAEDKMRNIFSDDIYTSNTPVNLDLRKRYKNILDANK